MIVDSLHTITHDMPVDFLHPGLLAAKNVEENSLNLDDHQSVH